MTEHLNPNPFNALDPEEQDTIQARSRTPHPYHHQSIDLPHLQDRFSLRNRQAQAAKTGDDANHETSPTTWPPFLKDSPHTSDSGSEADDEHYLRGLPAPRSNLHKGLRGINEPLSGSSSPLPSPPLPDDRTARILEKKPVPAETPETQRLIEALKRRRRVVVRRATEASIVLSLGLMVASNSQVLQLLKIWGKDIILLGLLYAGLLVLYPIRVVAWAYRKRSPSHPIPLELPAHFDPAPILYPSAITLFVSLLISSNNPAAILPNLVLSLASIPQSVIPKVDPYATYDVLAWGITCIPLVWSPKTRENFENQYPEAFISGETAVLLYPLHQSLCVMLHYLTTTSLLTAELQLLSIALINVLLLASSPQIIILKALLWGGGLSLLVFCGPIIRWGIALARVPKWRFRRASISQRPPFWKNLRQLFSLRRLRNELLRAEHEDAVYDTAGSSEDEAGPPLFKKLARVQTFGPSFPAPAGVDSLPSSPTAADGSGNWAFARRHTLPHLDSGNKRNATHTPSGRRKRATSMSVRPFFKLTQEQATMRKWLYAGYVYASIIVVILGGVRTYIERIALDGNEPIGWALGYLLGDWSWFRYHVGSYNLERWICLPPRLDPTEDKQCHSGWVQHVRHNDFGEANTRLLLSVYWLGILIMGLIVVFRLKDIYEVDTRRKVFHFMMVGMFLPATFVDPTYAALALSLILAVFLILDLLRASQLPPLSKPIASFLAPYVDGRDFRGPVVISHIFLLIGCAIPLWLGLASVSRTGSGYLSGWEVPARDVSLVAGVICVGLGDAAASLIGRRYGRRKWFWGGGKSLEGSLAFAVAVVLGLGAASIWLRIGGWPVAGDQPGVIAGTRNAVMCASMASLTEAVLTGGNDNVIVPVVLWTCVKSLGV
ncbi:dolichol kinase [Fusarium irregulare]|uniref:dolichol kinase n=1 Tax=Fusarium irregulare TaxID=2494466 RepID=A0A9W8UG24_9HYPO|nr:dolichol kinase [Fusarium irregulare]KAJ4025348.1 dolichol kinase [Fusarium irregulare]